MSTDFLAKKLSRLSTDRYLPASILSRGDRERLQPLFDCGVLDEERSGNGKRILLRNNEALIAFINRNYPSGLDGTLDDELPPRSAAVAKFRDAKKAIRTNADLLFLRGFGDTVLVRDGHSLPLGEWSRIAGVAAVRLDESISWKFNGKIAIVENLEVFLHFEKLKVPADIVYYAEGRLSHRVIDWLASSGMSGCHILHMGDYDPVGLDEYLRLKSACPGRVELYIPDNLDQLFKFGKKELLSKSAAVLARLRKSKDPAVQCVIELMNRYGVGLEQEILLSRRDLF